MARAGKERIKKRDGTATVPTAVISGPRSAKRPASPCTYGSGITDNAVISGCRDLRICARGHRALWKTFPVREENVVVVDDCVDDSDLNLTFNRIECI